LDIDVTGMTGRRLTRRLALAPRSKGDHAVLSAKHAADAALSKRRAANTPVSVKEWGPCTGPWPRAASGRQTIPRHGAARDAGARCHGARALLVQGQDRADGGEDVARLAFGQAIHAASLELDRATDAGKALRPSTSLPLADTVGGVAAGPNRVTPNLSNVKLAPSSKRISLHPLNFSGMGN
jgi:hypothetical protein